MLVVGRELGINSRTRVAGEQNLSFFFITSVY